MAQAHLPMRKPRGTAEETMYLVFWWLDQTPYVARFEDEEEADRAARIRNSLVVEVRGRDLTVPQVLDYYRRDEEGRPMPAKWKNLMQTPPRALHGRLPI